MKYLFMFLIASGSFVAASAQRYDRNDNNRAESYSQRMHDRNFNGGFRDREIRIAEVNRIYDHKIWEVKNDNRLSTHQKRKMVRVLNKEKSMRIREIKVGKISRY